MRSNLTELENNSCSTLPALSLVFANNDESHYILFIAEG